MTTRNGSGCERTSNPTVVTVKPAATSTITPSGPTTFCAGGSVTLTASAGASYLWSNGATTQSIAATASGNYSVTVTNADGCSATSAATTVTANATAGHAGDHAGGPTTFCAGGSVTLTASAGCVVSLVERRDDAIDHRDASGNYSVTVTNASGCSATSSATSVTVNALPTATITPAARRRSAPAAPSR